MSEISKYIKSTPVVLNRSQIHFASYNPRTISDEGRKSLKRGIKKFGMLGGIVVNKTTGYTIVSGHQRVSVMDELQKYDEKTKANDYTLRVDLIEVDEKGEKELNILLNNPNAQGEWDYDKMRELIPDIDYKDAGLNESDLSLIGCDQLFKTEEENNISDEIKKMQEPVKEQKEQEKAAKAEHMKAVKQEVRQAADKSAANMDAYIMLSFDSNDSKIAFCKKYGLDPDNKFIKGEDFDHIIDDVIEG